MALGGFGWLWVALGGFGFRFGLGFFYRCKAKYMFWIGGRFLLSRPARTKACPSPSPSASVHCCAPAEMIRCLGLGFRVWGLGFGV